MSKKLLRPAWVEIDLDAIDYNAKNIKTLAGNCEPLAIVKADAYGLGAPTIAKELKECGYNNFGVATLEEALELREAGIDDLVLVLGPIPEEFAPEVVENDITLMICDYDNAKAFNDEAVKKGKKIKCFIAIDTGMCRIGYDAREFDLLISEVKKIQELSNLEIVGIHSHMCTADEPDTSFAYEQVDRFQAADEALRNAGIKYPNRMIANSAGIMQMPETLKYEICRPGFILYGVYPSQDVKKENLSIKPAMSVKAKITFIKTIQPGDTVGYGRAFMADKPTVVATLPLGFSDGLSRSYSKLGEVLVGGKRSKILGNICMDHMMIDITDIPGVKVGDEVIIMGSDGKQSIPAEEILDRSVGMVIDEVVGHMCLRLPRLYVKSSNPNFREVIK